MRRTWTAAIVAAAMIAGWCLRVGAELLPAWDIVGFLASVIILAALVATLDHLIDKATTETHPGDAP